MPDDLDLMQLAASGELLTHIDDTDYRRVAIVFEWPAGGVPSVYCREQDWPTTPAARLADKERQIAELGEALGRWAQEVTTQAQRATLAEARITELERQLAEKQPASTEFVPMPIPPQVALVVERLQTPRSERDSDIDGKIACDYPGCDARIKPRGLLNHKRIAHQLRTIDATPAPESPAPSRPIIQFVEDLGWRCAAKGCAGSHARDLHDTDFCTLHAQRQLTNGVEATA